MHVAKAQKPVPAAEQPPQVNGQEAGPSIPQAPPVALAVKRRRPATFLAAALVLILAGGLAAVWAVRSSGERSTVVGMATEVHWGEVLTEADLAQVEVVPDANLRPVEWADRGHLVGKRAATDLMPGSLITGQSVMGDPIPGPGQAVIGVSVKSTQAPLQGFSPQDAVQLVVSQGSAGVKDTAPVVYDGIVVASSKLDASGNRIVDVLVASKDAPAIAVAAAGGNVVLVAVPRS